MKNKHMKNLIILLISLALSFFLIMFVSWNSFLRPYNPWCDEQWFIVMGRGILNGKVPYKDLFEQKGPITYFFFAILCLFKNYYIAIFIAEVICVGLCIFLNYKIASRFLNDYLSILASIIPIIVMAVSGHFGLGGGAVEEYLLPVITYIFLFAIDYFHFNKQPSKLMCILIGCFVAIIFLVKYTLLTLVAIILICYLINELIHKNFKQCFINISFMLIGFFVICVPVLIYFAVNHALSQFIHVYFYLNMFAYAPETNFAYISYNYYLSPILFTIVVIGLICTAIKSRKKSIPFILAIVITLLTVYTKGIHSYYNLQFNVYILLGAIYILMLCKYIKKPIVYNVASCILIIGLLVAFPFITKYPKADKTPKEKYIEFVVAKDINESGIENPSLFAYNSMEVGFYNAANLIPETYYYARNNFSKENYPEMFDAFDEYIKTKATTFVVVSKTDYNEKQEMFEENYNIYKNYNLYYLLIAKN